MKRYTITGLTGKDYAAISEARKKVFECCSALDQIVGRMFDKNVINGSPADMENYQSITNAIGHTEDFLITARMQLTALSETERGEPYEEMFSVIRNEDGE